MNLKQKIAAPIMALSMLVGASPTFAQTVKPGDTLSKIANSTGKDLDTIVKLNPQIKNPNLIFPGQNVKTTGTVAQAATPERTVQAAPSSSYEADLLARLIESEAKGESYVGKLAVASVVMNRVQSNQFPDSIQAVINQPGQFSPVSSGTINGPASADSRKAAQAAISGQNNAGNALYFYNPVASTSSWLDSKGTVKVIGNHVFKR